MITNPIRRSTCARLSAMLALAVIFSDGVSRAQAPNAAPASAPNGVVFDLEASCRPEAVQAVAAKLPTGVTVKEIPEAPKLPGGTKYVAAANNLPAYCQVTGSFVTNPNVGRTANFLATFPAAWNGKYLQIGCSGHCGNFAVSDAASRMITITCQGAPGEAIMKGYASFATDEGHVGLGAGGWAIKGPGKIDEEAVEDFYYRADRVLAGMGKAFTAGFYARANVTPTKISQSYFMGCSGGGRDALVAASFFPEEFDGIVAGSPAADLTAVSFQGAAGALANIRSEDADVPPALMSKVDDFVKAKCDETDGVKDGLIQNPAACDFRPERDLPRCDGKTPVGQCFTQAQIETISTLLTAVTDEHGGVVQPAYTVSELQAATRMPSRPTDLAATEPWPVSDEYNPGQALWSLSDANLRIFVHKNDPDFHMRSLFTFGAGGKGPVTNYRAIVPRAEVDRAKSVEHSGIGAHPELLAKLIKQNRKLLIWHNLSDQLLTPYMSINYYKQLAKMYGGYPKLQNNVRLFAIPGSAHCSMSGIGPSNFDALTAIEDWVEKSKAPDSLIAKLYNPKSPLIDPSKKPLRTMPLCKFPEMARYRGNGDVNDAVNWSCPAADKSMLKVGESGRQAGVIE